MLASFRTQYTDPYIWPKNADILTPGGGIIASGETPTAVAKSRCLRQMVRLALTRQREIYNLKTETRNETTTIQRFRTFSSYEGK